MSLRDKGAQVKKKPGRKNKGKPKPPGEAIQLFRYLMLIGLTQSIL